MVGNRFPFLGEDRMKSLLVLRNTKGIVSRKIYSFRLDEELVLTFDAVGAECGNTNRSSNLEKALRYLTQSTNIQSLKSVLQNG